MSIMTESGRSALALAVRSQPMHLAWGRGEESWGDAPPTANVRDAALINEVGRVFVHNSLFVVPDEEGELIMPSGDRYRVSIEPTPHLYMHFMFDAVDAAGIHIREMGVYIGTKAKDDVPPGKRYLLPTEIADPGILFMVDRRASLYREPNESVESKWIVSL